MRSPTSDILGLGGGSAASRHRQELVAASMGMVTTHALGACVSLGICDALEDGPLRLDELAARTKCVERPLRELLSILDALGVVRLSRHRIAILRKGRLLLKSSPHGVTDWITYAMTRCAPAWAELGNVMGDRRPATLRRQGIYGLLGRGAYPTAIFHRAMEDTQREVAAFLARHVRVLPGQVVADIGAGESSFLVELLNRRPGTRGIALDKFSRFLSIRKAARDVGVSRRLTLIKGDFLEPLPFRADVIVIKNVLADWNDRNALRILRNARRALMPGGRIYVATTIASAEPSAEEAVVSLNLRLLTEGGDRSLADYTAMGEVCGLRVTSRGFAGSVAILELTTPGSNRSKAMALKGSVHGAGDDRR